jgi:hypothetical protein
VAPSGIVHLNVLNMGGVPSSLVSAVVVNLTVTQSQAGGYLTAYADGTPQPVASNLNFTAGQNIANLAVVPVGSDGAISLFNGSGGSTQIIADISGYYLAGTPSGAGTYTSLPPTRIMDTRAGAPVAAGGTVSVHVTGGTIPTGGATAVVVNITVTRPQTFGFLTAYASGGSPPSVSNLNFVAAQTVAGLAMVPVGADGSIALFNGSSGTTDFIVDITGYYHSS